MLVLRSFIVNKLPEDGTLVLKHVGVHTLCAVCFIIWFTVFQLVNFVGLKYGIQENARYE